MKLWFLTIATILTSLTTAAFAQRVDWPPPQISSPLVTPLVSHQFVTGYPTLGSTLSQARPDFTDLSGSLASSQCPNGTTIATGCLSVGGGLSVTAGAVQVAPLSGVGHQWVSSINSLGVPQLTQPATSDVSTTINALVTGNGSVLGSYAGASCTNQALTSLSVSGAASCSSISNAYLTSGTFSNITGVGTLVAGATGSGFTVNFGTSTVSGVLAGVNGGTGVANTSKTITLGGNLVTTGAGASTLAFGAGAATFTFPTTSGGDSLAGLNSANVFTLKQTVNLNSASVPAFSNSVLALENADGVSTTLTMSSAAKNNLIDVYRANGTLASPSVLIAGNVVGGLAFGGYNGSGGIGYKTAAAEILATATETWSTSVNGLSLVFVATPSGSNASGTEGFFQSGLTVGSTNSGEGVGTVNALSGYFANSVRVISATGQGIFPGGLTATIGASTSALAYACYNVSTGVFTSDASSTCLMSSLRFKHDVGPVPDALRKVMAFDPIEFEYNDQSSIRGRQIGLSAESVASVEPLLATFDSQGRPEKVKYLGIVSLLTAAVQQQQREIEALQGVR